VNDLVAMHALLSQLCSIRSIDSAVLPKVGDSLMTCLKLPPGFTEQCLRHKPDFLLHQSGKVVGVKTEHFHADQSGSASMGAKGGENTLAHLAAPMAGDVRARTRRLVPHHPLQAGHSTAVLAPLRRLRPCAALPLAHCKAFSHIPGCVMAGCEVLNAPGSNSSYI